MSTTTATTAPFLTLFFDPQTATPDHRNRTLPQILSCPDSSLERSHDYIQTLFPLPEESLYQLSPTITPEIRTAFLARPDLRASLRAAFDRMLLFYGLQITAQQPSSTASSSENEASTPPPEYVVHRGPTWPTASPNWMRRYNHNHLRITRIIRSLRVLGLGSEAQALFAFLSTDAEVASHVDAKSQGFWRLATERELCLAPHEGDGAKGIEWLRGEW